MPILVEKVAALVATKNTEAAELFKKDFGHIPSAHSSLKQQRKELNNYLRIELSELEIDTTQQRSMLLDSITQAQWLEGVKSEVVPILATVWYKTKSENSQ